LAQAAAQALSALRYLSLKGVRHGDVKPANMLVDRTESGAHTPYPLQLIDFGAARLSLASRREAPRIGTPAYLPAPDLIQRETSGKTQPGKGHVHPDLYGLGMSLYHAAMGTLPFAIGDPASLRAWWDAREPARPSASDPTVSVTFDTLVARLTAVREEERFRSAADALEFLRGRT